MHRRTQSRRTQSRQHVASTLRDVARVAGVSIPTASQALNDRPGVNSETRTRVRDAASKLRYTPNSAARQLITGRAESIAVVSGSNMSGIFSDQFYRPMLTGAGSVVEDAGYRVLIAPALGTTSGRSQLMRMVRGREVDGILAVGIVATDWIIEMLQTGMPTVLVDNLLRDIAVPAVLNDEAWGAALAVRHLVELGHRRIGFVGAENDEWWAHEARAGYVGALGQSGLPRDVSLEVLIANNIDAAHEGAHALLSSPNKPSAVFAGSGKAAIGVMKAARECGLAIPEVLAVVGTGDQDFAAMFDPPLTTVSVRGEEIGRRSADLLLALINGAPMRGSTVIRPDLVVRGTSGASRIR